VLSIRHIPIATGFYYGASFASMFAILVGMLMAGISQVMPKARPWAALAVIAIVATQIVNYWPVNQGWLMLHNEEMARARVLGMPSRFQKRFPLAPGRPLTTTEVNGIWSAWKRGRMVPYIREHRLAPSAAYLVFELRRIDELLNPESQEDENDD
jgi:hypothetical protein